MRKQKLSESRINAAKQHHKTAKVIREEFESESNLRKPKEPKYTHISTIKKGEIQ